MVIGLTGGIGTGKSTAAAYLSGKGFAHVDADQIARDLTADGQPVLEIIKEKFGCVSDRCSIGNGLVLDRKALADVVFGDPEKRKTFDAVIHKEIIAEIDRLIAEHKTLSEYRAVLLDAPLLFEAGINDRCDVVILITADMDIRINRVVNRDGTTPDAVRARIANQMSDEEKIRYSDFIADNSGEPEHMYRQLDDIIEHLGI